MVKLEPLVNKIDYKTYKYLEVGTLGAWMTSLILSPFVIFNLDAPSIPYSLFQMMLWTSYTYLSRSDDINYKKDSETIEKLYNEFLKNYNKLNRTFELKDPYEMFRLFIYMLHNGYLSYNHIYNPKNENYSKLYSCLGSQILTGNGVCRHNSTMFRDVLRTSNIDAYTLGVHNENRCNEEDFEEIFERSCMHLLDIAMGKCDETIDEYISNEDNLFGLSKEECRKTIENLKDSTPNHLITFANYNDKRYLLDPMNVTTYRLNDDKNLIYNESSIGYIDRTFISLNDDKDLVYKKLLENHKDVSFQEMVDFANKINKLIAENYDLLDEFYKENKEIYSEVNDKTKSLIKRNFKLIK